MSDEEKKSKWGSMKSKISTKYSAAKDKWQEIKTELREDKASDSNSPYGQQTSSNSTQQAGNQIGSQHRCPVCNSPIAPELLPMLLENELIVCEHCGTEMQN